MMYLMFLVSSFAWSPAWAQAAPVGEEADEEDDLSENTIGGKKPPPASATGAATDAEILAYMNRPYNAASYRAADAMKSEVAMLDHCRKAMEEIYQRRYKDARKTLEEATSKYPGSGIGPLGFVVIYQALMFENYDYRYEKQYKLAFDQVRAQLAIGTSRPGDEAFESFVLAAALGVDAIHTMRKGEFLAAINRALEATKALEKTKAAAPSFVDTRLGDGLYLYWRTVVTANNKLLPQFEDKQAQGIALMKEAEAGSTFLGPGASLALAYSYIEERQLKPALDRVLYARMAYPDNVINNMTLGRIYTSLRKYEDALRVYGEVLVDAPDNQRTRYFRGIVLARLGRYSQALKEYETYLGFKEVPKEFRGQTYYRLGALYLRQKDTVKAESYYKQAITTSNNDAAKKALERLKVEKLKEASK